MKSDHVIGLIDAGAFAGRSSGHPNAWQHVQECATCAAALSAAGRVRDGLTALAQPAPPRDLSASVLARIAQLDDARAGGRDTATARIPAAVRSHRTSIWLTASGAAVVACAVGALVLSGGSDGSAAPMGGSVIRSGLMTISADAAVALAGLVVYAAGLFAAIDRGRSPARLLNRRVD